MGLLLSISLFTYAATAPQPYAGEITISACVNQTNGQVRIVKPWGPDPECVAPSLFAGVGTKCSEGGQYDCKPNEFFLELNTQGPKGDKGDPGPKGDKGDTGAPGESVVSIPLQPGDANCPFGGTQFNALSGTTYACNGAPGTKGDQGPKGDTGDQGVQGLQGIQGLKGDPGTNGLNGTNGANGLNCWDLNGNGACDPNPEDKNGDGNCDALDCTGPQGPAGTCSLPSCPAGQFAMSVEAGTWACRAFCTGAFVDTQGDPANCGACGVSCATGSSCVNGTCQAPPPQGCPVSDNPLVYPGQTSFFTTAFRTADGVTDSFDYDCDGVATPKWPSLTRYPFEGCFNGAPDASDGGWVGAVPSCGERGTFRQVVGLYSSPECVGSQIGDPAQASSVYVSDGEVVQACR